jgi:hypothetical protein
MLLEVLGPVGLANLDLLIPIPLEGVVEVPYQDPSLSDIKKVTLDPL